MLGFADWKGDHLCALLLLLTWWCLSSSRGCTISKPRLTLGRQILLGLLQGQATAYPAFLYGSADAAERNPHLDQRGGSGYISLLKTVIMPLVLVMMIAAVVRMREVADLGRIGGSVVGILVGTTAVAAPSASSPAISSASVLTRSPGGAGA